MGKIPEEMKSCIEVLPPLVGYYVKLLLSGDSTLSQVVQKRYRCINNGKTFDYYLLGLVISMYKDALRINESNSNSR